MVRLRWPPGSLLLCACVEDIAFPVPGATSMSYLDLARGPEGELALTGRFTDELDLGAGPVFADTFDSSVFIHRFPP